MSEPINQEIERIVPNDTDIAYYNIGCNGVTLIEQTHKNGMTCDIPYIRVWAGDKCLAEFCQHNLNGVYFK